MTGTANSNGMVSVGEAADWEESSSLSTIVQTAEAAGSSLMSEAAGKVISDKISQLKTYQASQDPFEPVGQEERNKLPHRGKVSGYRTDGFRAEKPPTVINQKKSIALWWQVSSAEPGDKNRDLAMKMVIGWIGLTEI